jgi:hypothetical protein
LYLCCKGTAFLRNYKIFTSKIPTTLSPHRLIASSPSKKKDAKKSLFIWQIKKKAVPLQPI